MFRTAPRLIASPVARAALPRSIAPTKRFISTAPPTQKSRSWKSLGARLAIAGTIIYYYNTTDVFAEEPKYAVQALPETDTESEHLPTIEAIAAERQKRKAVQAQLDAQAQKEAQSKQQNVNPTTGAEGGIGGLEEEADQQGAFNPETGEINWDCPCLGGMATGPCGEEFKAAFSCFVFSEEEPKGMDCIDKFKDMQNCFRKYPEVYGSELDADDDDDAAPSELPAAAAADSSSEQPSGSSRALPTSAPVASSKPPTPETGRAEKADKSGASSSKSAAAEKQKPSANSGSLALVPETYKPETKSEEPASESGALVPKAAHDTREENAK